MYNSNKSMKYLAVFIALFLISSIIVTCKVEKSEKTAGSHGIVIFQIGMVKIHKSGSNEIVDAQIKDILKENDIIKTGSNSFVTIQFQEKGVIKVQEKSTIKLNKIFNQGKAELYLKRGEVLSKIERLQKGDKFLVKTPTAVASVRGTEFIAQYNRGKSTVAVSKGKVSVGKKSALNNSTEDTSYENETVINEGSTAVVDDKGLEDEKSKEVKFNIRPMKEIEKLKAKQISEMKIIKDVEKKDKKELINLNKELIKKDKKIDIKLKPQIRQQKINNLMRKKKKSLAEIKEVFNRIDEITLYNQRVIKGAIISRGKEYKILTTTETVTVSEDQIKRVRVIK